MRRLTIYGLAVVTILVVVGVGAPAASAVQLPEFTVETKSTGTSKISKLNLTGAAITCTSGSSTASPTSKQLGTDTIWLNGCTLKGEECHSLADVAGNILVGTEAFKVGEYHIVRLLASGLAGIWYLLPAVHIECKFEASLVVVKGNVLGTIFPALTRTNLFEIKVAVVAGAQERTHFENNSGELVNAKLEGSINGGVFKAATAEYTESVITTSETEIIKDF